MNTKTIAISTLIAGSTSALFAGLYGDTPNATHAWAVHDNNRPNPKVIQAEAGKVPSDAVVLFDGTSLDAWVSGKDSGPAKWKLVDGAMEVVKGTGEIRTKQSFGDCQLHIEWASPIVVEGNGQGRGNSGIFLMGQHEVQVLDNYDNVAYADGQAGSVYAENPPLVNACRKPGEWQAYDIIFHQPVWNGDTLVHSGSVTVIHNGVVVQDHWEFEGMTTHCRRRPITKYEDKLPLRLQDHGNPVRFRNIWIREIPSRYANTTHGGPGVKEADVMALRKETAAKLFATVDKNNTVDALRKMLEIISYEKNETYMKAVTDLSDVYLAKIAGTAPEKLSTLKGEIIAIRNDCNVLARNKVVEETFKLKVALQNVIDTNGFEKKK